MLSIVVAISVLRTLISSECLCSFMRLLPAYRRWIPNQTLERPRRCGLSFEISGLNRDFLSVWRGAGGKEIMALPRRTLLEHIGAVGGAGAAYAAMETLGLAIPTPAGAEN